MLMNKKLIGMLPFLDDESITHAFREAVREGDKSAVAIALFLPEDFDWNFVVNHFFENENSMKLTGFYPFMSKESLTDLFVRMNQEHYKTSDVASLMPFVRAKMIDEVFLNKIREGLPFEHFLPFVSRKCLHQLACDYCEGAMDIPIDSCYPFMEDEDIRMIFRYFLSK